MPNDLQLGTLFDTPEDRAVQHAYTVLRGEHGPVKPSARQIGLLRIVADRRGAAKAVSVASLAATLGTTPREIKSDVSDLRRLFGVRIGSSRDGEAGGYYLITSTAELYDTVRPFIHQATSEFALVRAMCEPHELKELEGQMRLTASQEFHHV